ncbi:MAG TPA: hypothetical protein VG963_07005, partial [Polyangiaceae bacterium]|nr:hypothetical protein [Polyangiaceae bacterium]
APPPAHDGGGRSNGSLALGLARRCIALLSPCPHGSSPYDSSLAAELESRRDELDSAGDGTLATARAAAAEFAWRASAALVTATGSRAIKHGEHAERLAREALFLLVFGTRPAIRSALLERLGATPR